MDKSKPLILHLKYKYWQMIRDGEKTHEYRAVKPYWVKRIKDQSELILIPGYNNCNSLDIHAKIKSISVINWTELPKHAKDLFCSDPANDYFDIEFEVKKS